MTLAARGAEAQSFELAPVDLSELRGLWYATVQMTSGVSKEYVAVEDLNDTVLAMRRTGHDAVAFPVIVSRRTSATSYTSNVSHFTLTHDRGGHLGLILDDLRLVLETPAR